MVDLKDNLDEAVEEIKEEAAEIKDEFVEKAKEIEARLAEERAKLEAEFEDTVEDAKGFFEEHKVAVFIGLGVLAAGALVLLLL